jgi:hypothetical protein
MYICTRVYHNVTISLKKFFITNPLILEEQNSFKSLEHRLSNFLEWGTLPWQYGIVPVTLALALLIKIFLCFQRGIIPTKFRGSKFPGNMHNYIWCPYYLPSFMKFCSVVSEELRWQAASEVYFGKYLSSKGHNSHTI